MGTDETDSPADRPMMNITGWDGRTVMVNESICGMVAVAVVDSVFMQRGMG